MAKKTIKSIGKQVVKDKLSSFLGDELINDVEDIVDNSESLDLAKKNRTAKIRENNFEIEKTAHLQAKAVIDTCLKFYLKESFIMNDEYIQARAKVEKMSLQGLYEQIALNRELIKDLSEKILNSGSNLTSMARLYEVFAKLQEVNLNISKMITQQVAYFDERIVKLRQEHEYYNKKNKNLEIKDAEITQLEDKTSFKGQKDLMKMLKEKNKKNNEDVIVEEKNNKKIEDYIEPNDINKDNLEGSVELIN